MDAQQPDSDPRREAATAEPPATQRLRRPRSAPYRSYGAAALTIILCSLLGLLAEALQLDDAIIAMIFLAGVVYVSANFGRGPAIAAAVLGTLVFDYFFVPPVFSFALTEAQYFITMGVLLGIGLVISTLTAKLQDQLDASSRLEHRTAQLYRLTRQLNTLAGTDHLTVTAGQVLSEMFPGEVAIFSREPDDSLLVRYGEHSSIVATEDTQLVRQVLERGSTASHSVGTAAAPSALFVPMQGAKRTIGVVGIRPRDAACLQDLEQRQMLEACAGLIALSIERDQSFLQAQQAQVDVQTEQLRNSLLSAVSHDLRTPLATIAVTASSLCDNLDAESAPLNREMAQTVVDESRRLTRQVDNLLGMARLNCGTVVLHRDWEALEELVGLALARLKRELAEYQVSVQIDSDFPLLWVAGDLLELVLINLLENAVRYTPPGSRIEFRAVSSADRAEIHIADNGPGLPPNTESQVFEKFFRGRSVVADGQRGIGLGLSICRAIVEAHGGRISARNQAGGGAEFTIDLPCSASDAQVAPEEVSESIGIS
jgi:two-component system, OmpR family, sensor histidine kinase KdpD